MLQVIENSERVCYTNPVTASNGRFCLPHIVLYKLPIIRNRALEAVTSTRTLPGGRHFVLENNMKRSNKKAFIYLTHKTRQLEKG
jgi:hypothetical protein